jgi:hypothetical protein
VHTEFRFNILWLLLPPPPQDQTVYAFSMSNFSTPHAFSSAEDTTRSNVDMAISRFPSFRAAVGSVSENAPTVVVVKLQHFIRILPMFLFVQNTISLILHYPWRVDTQTRLFSLNSISNISFRSYYFKQSNCGMSVYTEPKHNSQYFRLIQIFQHGRSEEWNFMNWRKSAENCITWSFVIYTLRQV